MMPCNPLRISNCNARFWPGRVLLRWCQDGQPHSLISSTITTCLLHTYTIYTKHKYATHSDALAHAPCKRGRRARISNAEMTSAASSRRPKARARIQFSATLDVGTRRRSNKLDFYSRNKRAFNRCII